MVITWISDHWYVPALIVIFGSVAVLEAAYRRGFDHGVTAGFKAFCEKHPEVTTPERPRIK